MKGGGVVQSMWIIHRFYNIILKSTIMDGGGGMFSHKMWINVRFFIEPLSKEL